MIFLIVCYFRNVVFLIALCLLGTKCKTQDPIPPIGHWRDHLPYHSATDLAAGDGLVWCSTPYSIFSIDLSENTVTRYSRINGLAETGVSRICYDESTKKLLVVYRNSNLDLFFRNDIFNIPEIKNDNITGDKTVYAVFPYNNRFYLSTGLGVIVIDAVKHEVSDTWLIGSSGGQVRVNGFIVAGTFFYAATSEGLKRIPLSNPNPANYNNWQLLSGQNGLNTGACRDVTAVQNKIFVLKDDSLFEESGTNWSLFFTEPGWSIRSVNSSSDKLIVCQAKNDGSAKITAFKTDGTLARVIQQPGLIVKPENAILLNDDYWVADSIGGLTRFRSAGFESYTLNSPFSVANGGILFHDQVLYASSGGVNTAWQGQGNKNGIYQLKNGQWTNYSKKSFPLMDSLPDIISLAVDPRDASIWAGSYGGGLLHIKTGNNFEIFKQNSPIGAATFDQGSYRVSGLLFDREKNLWIANYGAAQSIAVRKSDNNWKTFTIPFALSENAVSQLLVDDENQKWIVSPKGNGLICFNDAGTIDNAGDDRWKLYKTGQGNGNLPSGNVLSIIKDRNGFIWIGTGDGIAIVQCPQNVFSPQGCDAVLPVVQQGGFNQFLFKGEQVNCIAVDGADRKWVGTKNGAWLISPEGDKVIFRFTETNSPLLSNDVKKITIDERTGEIFFATTDGICSFRSTATKGGEHNENVLVFPNPVPPGYIGTIAIRGLVNDAIVKITELDGRLVYQTRALGGQAVWDGRDYRGRRISSGVYLVLVSDESRKENLATKIVFISK